MTNLSRRESKLYLQNFSLQQPQRIGQCTKAVVMTSSKDLLRIGRTGSKKVCHLDF